MMTNSQKGFTQIVSLVLVTLISLGAGYFGSEIKQNQIEKETEESIVLGAFNPTGGGTYRLKSSISSTATSLTLTSFKEPVSETLYSMAYLNTTIMYGTIEPLNPDKSEFISFTGITQNADGTATLTGVSRGLARSYPYTASTTHAQTHPGQSIFILSDTPQLFNTYLNAADTETITGDWTFASTSAPSYDARWNIATSSLDLVFADWVGDNYLEHASTSARDLKGFYTFTSTGASSPIFNGLLAIASSTFAEGLNTIWPTASSSATSKGYVDSVATAGVDASETAKGIVEQATPGEINSGTSVGGTGARLFVNPLSLSLSKYASTTAGTATTTKSANADYDISTTTTLTSGQTIMVWVSAVGQCNIGTGNNGWLYIKPPSAASTTLDHVILSDCNANNHNTTYSMIGNYTATSTGSYKLYITNSDTATPDYWAVGSASSATTTFMYLKLNSF